MRVSEIRVKRIRVNQGLGVVNIECTNGNRPTHRELLSSLWPTILCQSPSKIQTNSGKCFGQKLFDSLVPILIWAHTDLDPQKT